MKVQTYVETCQPGESPRFGFAKPPPFDKGGFGQAAVTGHWRGSNDLQKTSVRNCHRGHPGVRIVSGDSPQKTAQPGWLCCLGF